jgi:hypothetical protein
MTDTLPPLPPEVLDFDQFLNEPPEYEDMRKVREYRHAAYAHWVKVVDAIREYGKACAALPAAQPEHAIQALNDSLLLDPDMPVRGVHLEAAQPTVNPPEFQEVSWGVDSVMRPCLGMAVSEYAFRQWAKDVGIVLAAPVAQTPAGVKGPEHG